MYRVSAHGKRAMLTRIPDDKLPKTLKPMAYDSFTLPLVRHDEGYARLFYAAKVLTIDRPPESAEKATATMQLVVDNKIVFATIKRGDTLLFGKYGCEVRAIVPRHEAPGVAGWVEFGPQFTPEDELIRLKKTFVRPMPKQEDKK